MFRHQYFFKLCGVVFLGLICGCGVGVVESKTSTSIDDESDSELSSDSTTSLPSCASLTERCEGTACEPSLLVSEPDRFIESVRSHGKYLFYLSCARSLNTGYHNVDLCELKRFTKRTGAIKTLATNLGSVLGGIAVNSSSVFFGKCVSYSQGCQIIKYSRRTGSLEVLVDFGHTRDVNNLRLDSTHLYWSGHDGTEAGRVPVNGGAFEQIISSANNDPDYPEGLPDYLVDVRGDSVFLATNKIKTISKTGIGRTEKLFDFKTTRSANAIAIDDDYVYTRISYWHSNDEYVDDIARTPLLGGETTYIARLPPQKMSRGAEPHRLAGMMADGRGNLIWTTEQNGTRMVKMYVRNENRVVELARGIQTEWSFFNYSEAMALDSQRVYFAASTPESQAAHEERCAPNAYDCVSPGAIYATPLCQP